MQIDKYHIEKKIKIHRLDGAGKMQPPKKVVGTSK